MSTEIEQRFEGWRGSLYQALMPILATARGELCKAQSETPLDEKVDDAERLIKAKLEPVLVEHEQSLEPIRQAAEEQVGGKDEPTERERKLLEGVQEAVFQWRDWVDRKVASMVAQARAQELLPPEAQQPAQVASQASHQAGTEAANQAANDAHVAAHQPTAPQPVYDPAGPPSSETYTPLQAAPVYVPQEQPYGQQPSGYSCPVCGASLTNENVATRRCTNCMTQF